MNIQNIKKAIAIMERAQGKVSMLQWQSSPQGGQRLGIYEAELHACGNVACFAGWIAVSPEFQADGGGANPFCGFPVFQTERGFFVEEEAIEKWLDIPYEFAESLVHGNREESRSSSTDFCNFYGKPWRDVNNTDVIEKLKTLLESEDPSQVIDGDKK